MSWTGVWAVGAVPWVRVAEYAGDGSPASGAPVDRAEALLDLMGSDTAATAPFVATARKADPAAAMVPALADILPGFGGDFVVSPAEVPGIVAALRAVASPGSEERERLCAEAGAWMRAHGDEPDFRPEEVVDGLIAVMEAAAGCGQAVAGVSLRY
ncbi:hypothetical protein O4J56_10435 [Nocardiopsis sp. RSe5-2]|uniref:Uncharacterized protein n=1 Tax=Nocardiopsis endophytica TaxID=3018445 RepID=A0ABT4U270_9ACTN|nr:hypothetical protein [Nocardiopsis endophytica]MDA2811053.1 hypothetical protein [Nocardiopsis endophytica]